MDEIYDGDWVEDLEEELRQLILERDIFEDFIGEFDIEDWGR